MPVLTFDDPSHKYQIDGREVPSVTQVLESVGIIDYSKLPDDTREAALERGKLVHLACEFYDAGVLDERTVDPKISGYVDAWKRFRRETGFVPDLIEHRGMPAPSTLMPYPLYAGTLDRTGGFPSRPGTRFLLDIKTGEAQWWVKIQLAAYAGFFTAPRTYQRLCVELHKKGTYDMSREYNGRDWQADYDLFLSALNVTYAKQANAPDKRRAA